MPVNIASEAADIFDFQWPKAVSGYELKDIRPPRGGSTSEVLLQASGLHIVRRGAELSTYPPRAIPDLHRRFAALDDTPAAVLKFVQSYGFLGIYLGPWQQPRDTESESVEEILAARNRMRKALADFDELRREESRMKSTWMNMRDEGLDASPEQVAEMAGFARQFAGELFNDRTAPRFTLRLRPAGHGLALRFEPQSLLGLMYLQVAEELTGGAKFAYCERCHKPMPIGKGGGRIDKKTCSDACRVALSTDRRKRKAEAESKTAKKSKQAKKGSK